MPRKRAAVPSYLHHKPTNRAKTYVYDAAGKRHVVYLGEYGSAESKRAYQRVLEQIVPLAEPPKKLPSFKPKKNATLAEVCAAFLSHAATYYRRQSDGKLTSEFRHFSDCVAILSPEHDSLASKFGRAALSASRERMLEKGWTRQHINAQVRRIRTMWRWAEEHELLPEGSWGRLQILRGLKLGRSAAPEQAKVDPVSDADVAATIPHLPPTVARMVRFHRLTGCRPQDVCSLAWERIDRSSAVWVYSPRQHKGAHLGHSRAVMIGPTAQAEMGTPGMGIVFAHDSSTSRLTVLRKPRGYSTQSYCRAITRACERAGVEPWTPNQLRHTALTEFRAKYGLEVARAIGGHKSAVTTEIYAEKPAEAILKAVGEMG